MTPLPIAIQAALAALVLVAAFTDLRKREIPNWLTLGGVAAGLALNPWISGWAGLKSAALGLGLAALVFVPIFIMRWLGGGDVKLMAAIGALAGPSNMMVIFVLDAIFGGVVALAAILLRGRLKKTLRNVTHMFRSERDAELEAGNEKSMGMPRAVTIAAATLLVLWASRG
ncbi:MAG: prepilin peptidase [Candidatus Solibacter usitatus]|nr:prepilin peptidase [Candidatus Solibacter usitatus]